MSQMVHFNKLFQFQLKNNCKIGSVLNNNNETRYGINEN